MLFPLRLPLRNGWTRPIDGRRCLNPEMHGCRLGARYNTFSTHSFHSHSVTDHEILH